MTMSQCPKCKKEIPFLVDKKTAFVYSLYLAIGSVALFVSLTALNTAYQGYIWSYSVRYVVNSFTLALVLFIAGVLLLIACLRLMQAHPSARLYGFIGLGLLVLYSFFVLLIDPYISYTLDYVLILLVAMIILFAGAFLFWKKKPS
jgi:hypothetical protein